MSSTVDNRIVEMKFDSASFESGATKTLSILDKLKQNLNFSTAAKGLSGLGNAFSRFGTRNPFAVPQKGLDILGNTLGRFGLKNPFATTEKSMQGLQTTANRFSMSHMEGGITSVSSKFLALTTIGVTALATLTNKAVNAGLQMAKSLTIAPVMDGFHEYETNLNSIQTILSNTGLEGQAGLNKVNSALNELNTYSDKTIYNFSEMARNIGTFTAAGVDLKTSTASIKGIANLAAISGSNSQQASTAMYQLSQAIASGKVGLQDWNSVVNAGMGGKVFQTALTRTAQNMGTLGKNSISTSGKMKRLTIDGKSFRESLTAKPGQKSWLTSDVLTETLKQFGGNMTRAQLKAEGFSKAQQDAILKMGKMGTDAATKVKTLSQLMSTLKEGVGSGWAKTWQIVFGDFGEAKSGFTAASNYFGNLISNSAKARNDLLKSWKHFGGRDAAIDALTNGFQALMHILGPIKAAFREIFPAKSGYELAQITRSIAAFMDNLIAGKSTMDNIKRTFAGVFAVFDIAKQIIGGLIGVVVNLFKQFSGGGGGILKFTAGIGDFLVSLDQAIKKGDAFQGFFDGLTSVLAAPVRLISNVAHALGNLFGGFDTGKANALGGVFDSMGKRLSPIAALGQKAADGISHVMDAFSGLGGKIGDALSGIGDAIAASLTPDTFSHALDAVNTGLLAALVLMIKKFMNGGSVKIDVGGGLFGSIKKTFGTVTDTLENMQTNIKANVLMKIAGALAILTASILVLSTIDPKKLATAMAGITVGFAGLQVSLVALSKAVSTFGTLKLPLIAASLAILGAGMLIFSLALKVLASIPFGQLEKGLLATGALLAMLVAASEPLSKNSAGMIRAGVGMTAIAVAINILVIAVARLGKMDLRTLGQGLGGVAAALAILAGGMRLMPKNMTGQAAALLILGAALNVIAVAVKGFGSLDINTIAKGFGSIAAALLIIAGAMRLMPKNMLVQAAALLVVSGAITVIGNAVASMGGLSMEEIAKGLGTLAGALVILAAGLYLMSGSLAGAAALVVAAGALALLVPVMVALGAMSWEGIAKGLVALAGAFTVIGIAGLLLTPIIPSLLGLGAALILIGAGLALAGAAALAFATAFTAVVAAGSVGVAVLSGILNTIIQSIPKALGAFGRGIVAFASAIGKGAPAFFHAFSAIIRGILNAVISNVPRIGRAFLTIVQTALRVIVRAIPSIVNAGMQLIIGLLRGISRNIPRIVPLAATTAIRFMNALGKQAGRLADAGARMIIKVVNGVSRAINAHSGAMGAAGGRLAAAIVTGMIRGIAGGIGAVANAARNLASSALAAAKHKLGIASPSKEFHKIGQFTSEGFANGMDDHAYRVERAGRRVATTTLDTVREAMKALPDALDAHADMRPVVRPVLDLSQFAQDASKMHGYMPVKPTVKPTTSYTNATDIAKQHDMIKQAAFDSAKKQDAVKMEFYQYNTSPKAIGATEVYRGTRSQLSLAKEALKKNAVQ